MDYTKLEKNPNYNERTVSYQYEIGQYLNVGKNPKLDKIWEEKLNSFKEYDKQTGTSSNYRNSLSKPNNIR